MDVSFLWIYNGQHNLKKIEATSILKLGSVVGPVIWAVVYIQQLKIFWLHCGDALLWNVNMDN